MTMTDEAFMPNDMNEPFDTPVQPSPEQPPNPAPDAQPQDDPVSELDPLGLGSHEEAPASDEVKRLEQELQRVRSENGRAAALAEELRKRDEENARLREQLKARDRDTPDFSHFAEEELEGVDPNILSLIDRHAKHLLRQSGVSDVAGMSDELRRSRDHALQAERKQMWRDVAGAIPGLEQFRNDPAFKAWSRSINPITRKANGELLNELAATVNTEGVIDLLKQFSREAGYAATAPGARIASVPRDPRQAGRGTQKPVYSQRDIDAFFEAQMKGELKMSPEDAKRVTAEYDSAIREGRVAP